MSMKQAPGCGRKRRFRDKVEAVAALHYLQTRSQRDVIPVRAYECDECLGWHLTSMEARV